MSAARQSMDAGAPAAAADRPKAISPWMITATGRAFPLLAPAASDIDPRDLAEQAAKINRFTGATGAPYSDAQHMVLVSGMVPPEAVPYALLHDAHEVYRGDDSTPVQEAYDTLMLALYGIEGAYTRARAAFTAILDRAIHARFALPWPPEPAIAAAVKHADLVALATEFRDLMPVPARGGPAVAPRGLPAPHPRRIKPWAWPTAADIYARRLRQFGLV